MPTTTYHGVNLPTVNNDPDTWGDENNTAHQAWDTLTSGGQFSYLGRIASGTGPMTQLTGAQVLTGLPTFTTSAKGLVPQSAAAEAIRPLTGDGTFNRRVARAAGGKVDLTATTAVLDTGASFNVASATWADIDGTLAKAAIVFTTAMPNDDYQVALGYESNSEGTQSYSITAKTAAGFTFIYAKSFHTAVGLSVFEG